ncbi:MULTISPECIES: L-serine ammonia-lyase, iron-sulfur-dependent subunit beta [Aminobacterium]|jgi:L-serine dehydratase|uniref:L-serine ammonia-lyase, iron-sulfur-dependent subunit beta n=1 Tax=Aminobacterium TaxID=81466 RepID=UPI00257F19A2|nr:MULTISPECIES: L-serine ammonia-lyase, iron-sulfur-dependent subunit beta [unclassified Aminobacterium]
MPLTEIIGPVMIGPSSSHTAGAARLGRLALACWGEDPLESVEIFLRGSFAYTSYGHGTDRALVAGLLGMAPDDMRLRNALSIAKELQFNYRFDVEEVDGAHPNSARFVFTGKDNRTLEVIGASIGGGAVELQEIDGFKVSVSGELPSLITIHRDTHGVVAAITKLFAEMEINIATLSLYRKSKGGMASLVIELDLPSPPDDSVKQAMERAHPSIIRVLPLYARGGTSK